MTRTSTALALAEMVTLFVIGSANAAPIYIDFGNNSVLPSNTDTDG